MKGIKGRSEEDIKAGWARSTPSGLEVQRAPIKLVETHGGWV